ncbi:MAG: ribonuclease Y [Nitrospirae bacterium]|nr:ribonuclease Y [Nitrospirota bacterium]
MIMDPEIGLILLGSLLAGTGLGWLIKSRQIRSLFADKESFFQQKLEEAQKESENKKTEIFLEAKSQFLRHREDLEKEIQERRQDLTQLERKLGQKEESLERRSFQISKKEEESQRKERELIQKERESEEKKKQLENGFQEIRFKLENLSGITAEEARRQLVSNLEDEAKFEAGKSILRIEEETRETAEKKAKEIITTAIQRYANEYVAETTCSVLTLPGDDMKGRIIGREGRNIRALEAATGIDLIIDDTPGAVIISGFDPVRREIAKLSLERLMSDGRIHPSRIEEVVEKVKKDLDKTMKEDAEKVLFELGVADVHPEIVKILGRLKYRTSYGQNNLMHAKEAAIICSMMAEELRLDVKLAKRGALLHDIGKAVSHEEEGPHAMIGADIAKKYNESPQIVNAIAAHHGDVECICPESALVAAAESISAARPGARRENLESYIKRLEKLEKIATSYKGVEKAYAIQAGREIRIIVKEEDVTDNESAQISRDIAKKIQTELTYPGQIKITVIRESRFVEYAK